MPLAFTQEDFLVSYVFEIKEHACAKNGQKWPVGNTVPLPDFIIVERL